MTLGEKYAVIILTAKELELNASYTCEAEELLKSGKINRSLIGLFEKEADRLVQLIYTCNLLQEALRISEKFIPK